MSSEYYVQDHGLKEMLLNTEGRLNRKRYFKRSLLLFGIIILCTIIAAGVFSDAYGNPTSKMDTAIFVIAVLGCGCGYCLNLRRLHDIGGGNAKKIALVVLGIDLLFCFDISELLSTIMGVIALPISLYMLFYPGTTGPNEYGPDPLGVQMENSPVDESATNDVMQGDIIDLPTNNLNSSSSSSNLIDNVLPQNTNQNYNTNSLDENSTNLDVEETDNTILNEDVEEESVSDNEDNDDDVDDDDTDGFNITDLF